MSTSHGEKKKKKSKKTKKMIRVGEYQRLYNNEDSDSGNDNPQTTLIPPHTSSESSGDESVPSSDEDTKQSIEDLKETIRDRQKAERRLYQKLLDEQQRLEKKVDKSRKNKLVVQILNKFFLIECLTFSPLGIFLL
jgi:hypothetical protein